MPSWEGDHLRILDVVRSKKLGSARKEIQNHVAKGFDRVSKHFAEGPKPAAKPKKRL
jgi:DNA-binding GntR family transcriptional regulator